MCWHIYSHPRSSQCQRQSPLGTSTGIDCSTSGSTNKSEFCLVNSSHSKLKLTQSRVMSPLAEREQQPVCQKNLVRVRAVAHHSVQAQFELEGRAAFGLRPQMGSLFEGVPRPLKKMKKSPKSAPFPDISPLRSAIFER